MSSTMNVQTTQGIIANDPTYGILMLAGPTVPTDAAAGYAPGCLFLDVNSTGNGTVLYVNNGTKASCSFKPARASAQGSALTSQLTTITPADAAGTPDYAIAAVTNSVPYGFSNAAEAITLLYVVKNLQTRLAEVESRLQSAGLIA